MNFLKTFLNSGPRKHFLEFSPLESTWRVVTWNFDLKDSGQRQWTVEVHGHSDQTIEWRKEKHGTSRLIFFKNNKNIFQSELKQNDKLSEARQLMNLSLHSTIKYGLESNQSFMVTPVAGALPGDFQSESKALQWIQVSLGTLTRSLARLKEDPNLILTAALFSGIEPGSGERVLRVLAFNLDIFCYMKEDNSLQIAIFDDKNLGHGESKTPTFQQNIKVTKPQFYDEIGKLVHSIAQVGEI